MICFHHNDADGLCSGAIIYRKYSDSITMVEIDYKMDFPFDKINEGEEVVIVDFSLEKPGEWAKLWEITHNIIWLDHHESAIKIAPHWLSKSIEGIRDIERSGCMLAWDYFNSGPLPEIIKIIDKWDRWKHNDDPYILNIISGMELEDMNPKSDMWDMVFEGRGFNHLEENGEIINLYKAKKNKEDVMEFSYDILFEGYKLLVLHTTNKGSKVFDSVKKQYDIYTIITYDGNIWEVSLYSHDNNINVADIALKYGGGGHKSASGFQCQKLPWVKE